MSGAQRRVSAWFRPVVPPPRFARTTDRSSPTATIPLVTRLRWVRCPGDRQLHLDTGRSTDADRVLGRAVRGLPGSGDGDRIMSAERSHRFAITGKDLDGNARTIILWRESDLVDGRVVRRVVVTLDATMNTATVLTRGEAAEVARAILAAAQ